MPKVFVLAPDSFKESLSAEQACQAMQRAIFRVLPDARCIAVPMADGGEGTLEAFLASLEGERKYCQVRGPLASQQISSYWGWIGHTRTAVIEMARVNGIHLLEPAQRNPLLTSTYGTGELVKQALDLRANKIILALGGSVTNDAGAGLAQALGARFYNVAGETMQVCGGNLDQIRAIDLAQLDPRLLHTEVLIASDVNNPLCGENGASFIFGPQKGATPEMVQTLDQNLQHFADLVEMQLGQRLQDVAGAGAAGGLGFGLMAFAGAKIQSGVELLVQVSGLAEKIAQADVVLTGEGKIDRQTQWGKTPFGVAQLAKQLNKPVIAFAGLVGKGIEPLYEAGFSQIITINPPGCSLAEAMKHAEMHLEQAVAEAVKKL